MSRTVTATAVARLIALTAAQSGRIIAHWCAANWRKNVAADPNTTQRTPGDPTASLKQFRAALNFLPRDVQRKVRLLWLKGHCANAIELVDRELK